MFWDAAITHCSNLGSGWRLPTLPELGVLNSFRDDIGGFVSYANNPPIGEYWSAERNNDWSGDDPWYS
jgi:hypothetical protein